MELPVVVLLTLLVSTQGLDESNIHDDDFIQMINDVQDSWRAARNFHPGSFVKNLLSVLPPREEHLPQRSIKVRENLPKVFDGRKKWWRCRSLSKVKDQGNCASAWAIVATSVLTDRLCISKIESVEISSQNVLSCCKVCGTNCFGGYVSDALEFLTRKGAPTWRCHPYEIPECPKIGVLNCPAGRTLAPRCRVNCRKTFSKNPFQDTRKAGQAYSVSNSSDAIKTEIIAWGSIAAVMDLYEDFMVYKEGVYSHTAGRFLGHHPVRVIGWGETVDSRPFWIIVNTWSSLWGEEGFAKVAMNSAGCNLENRVFAIDPQQ